MKYSIKELDLMRHCIVILYMPLLSDLYVNNSCDYLYSCQIEEYKIQNIEELLRTFMINETLPIELYDKALKKLENRDKKYSPDFDLNIAKDNLNWYIKKTIKIKN